MEYRREYGMVSGRHIDQRGMVWERKIKEEKGILKDREKKEQQVTATNLT